MPVIVETQHGRLRGAKGSPSGWLLECPGCCEWLPVSEDMLHGRISVDHDHDGCAGHYHETHDFAAAMPMVGGEPPLGACACGNGMFCQCGPRKAA